jgi:hypothetical protein
MGWCGLLFCRVYGERNIVKGERQKKLSGRVAIRVKTKYHSENYHAPQN